MTRVTRYLPGGGVRKLFETRDRHVHGAVPRRGSRVEIVDAPDSAAHGRFFVDFSPLGPGYQCCLRETFEDYDDAVQAERAWILENWVLAPLADPS